MRFFFVCPRPCAAPNVCLVLVSLSNVDVETEVLNYNIASHITGRICVAHLLYIRNEVRFYEETLPRLRAKGFLAAPEVYIAQHNLQKAWLPETESDANVMTTPKEAAIYAQLFERHRACEHDGEGGTDKVLRIETGVGILVMECISEQRYWQDSPLTPEQAKLCLAAAADLHAAGWTRRIPFAARKGTIIACEFSSVCAQP